MRFSLPFLLLLFPIHLFALQKDSLVSLPTGHGVLYGTLTTPDQKTGAPLVIIIAGSGPTDRDGNQHGLRNNSLLALGDSLAMRGIASMRYDKRGIAASKEAAPDESKLRFDDYVSDAVAWVKYYQADTRFSKIFIVGHSEGSLIGMLAVQRIPVAGYISIAGVSVSADSVILTQMTASPMIAKSMIDSMRMFFGMLRQGQTIDPVPKGFYQALLRKSVQPYVASWMKYNPAKEIAKLHVPVLIVQGNTDIQVDTMNAYALAAAKPGAKLVVISNMNHVLKDVSSRDPADNQLSYVDPGFLLNSKLTPAISSFIFSIARKKK